MNRVINLDYLRGIMAFSIMIYHYSYYGGWNNLDPNYLINKLSIYGVIIFFILSGMSLFLAYKNFNFLIFKNILLFIYKRFSRILPLFWLVICLYLLFFLVTGSSFPDIKNILYAYSLSFGFFYPMPYFATGAWSIGVEIVLYFSFPIIFLLLQNNKLKFLIWISLLILFWFTSFKFLDNDSSFSSQWKLYIIPLNHLFYFASGIIIAQSIKISKNYQYGILMLLSIIMFYFYPVSERIDLISGIDKVFLSLFVITFMYSVFHYNFSIHNSIKKQFIILGEISYALYLLHPIVLKWISYILSSTTWMNDYKLLVYILSALFSLSISYYIYNKFEKPCMIKLRDIKS